LSTSAKILADIVAHEHEGGQIDERLRGLDNELSRAYISESHLQRVSAQVGTLEQRQIDLKCATEKMLRAVAEHGLPMQVISSPTTAHQIKKHTRPKV